jgi:hypothetical protein
VLADLPDLVDHQQVPKKILQKCFIAGNSVPDHGVLVKWSSLSESLATVDDEFSST